jgi:hypothetical protein
MPQGLMRMGIRRVSIAVSVALGCGCAGTPASRSGVIAGLVVDDSTGTALGYSHVQIVQSDRDILLEAAGPRTFEGARDLSADGVASFAIGDSPAGFYLVRASFVGYLPGTERVKVIANDTTLVTVRLRRDPTFKGVNVVR